LQKNRILFVLEFFDPHIGGVETLFLELTKGLADSGWKPTVVTSRLPGTKKTESFAGIQINRVSCPPFLRRYFFTVLSLPRVIREAFACDIIHTTTYNAALPAWIASVFTRRPAIVTVHEVFAKQWNTLRGLNFFLGFGFRFFEWFVLRLPFHRYVCDSKFTMNRFNALFRSKVSKSQVVYPSFDHSFWDRRKYVPKDLHREMDIPNDRFIFLYFGRPGISKGLEYLIEAAPCLEQVNAHLVMILSQDPATQFHRLMKTIKRKRLNHRITVAPPLPRQELPAYLLGADCIVLPSVSEGFGYSALEAVTLGCRVITTGGHSVEEILPQATELVPARDATSLAAKMTEVATTDRNGPCSSNVVFTRENFLREMMQTYRQVYEACK
jgi:D-inositol-3-phosphate glycosyltransferase